MADLVQFVRHPLELWRRGKSWLGLVVLALLYTGFNSIKPLQVDDSAYYYFAKQIAAHPLDPYGFQMFWYQYPAPANYVLAPPGLPYWWAVAIGLFGEHPFLWKLWLFPFSLLFVLSLERLFHRFARGLEMPLVWMTVLSPTFLPSLNLMLDVPALSLSLCALNVFFRAIDRQRPSEAFMAALLAGLAMQTKYTAFLAPATMVLYALVLGSRPCRDQPWPAREAFCLALFAGALAAWVFVLWEVFVYKVYGVSHFLLHLEASQEPLVEKLVFFFPLVTILGGVTPALSLLGLAGLGCRRWVLATGAGVGAAGYLLVAVGESCLEAVEPASAAWLVHRSLEHLVYGFFGVLFAVIAIAGVLSLCRGRRGRWWPPTGWLAFRVECFLVLWFLLEAAGYFALTPFPAVRRVMGLVVVGTILVGRLAARTCRSRARRRVVYVVASFGIALGMVFFAIDVEDARAEQAAAEQAADWVRQQNGSGNVWYLGHWGFQFYAERAGMIPVVPGASTLLPGDWLVVPDKRLNQQTIVIDAERTEPAIELDMGGGWPLRTVQCYYGGRIPLEHHEGPRVKVTIYRITGEFIPGSIIDGDTVREIVKPP